MDSRLHGNDTKERDRDDLKRYNQIMIILLDNIRSIFNVGAIFRTCDAVGAEKLILSGYTPYPPEPKLLKTSLGAIDSVAWENLSNEETLNFLQKRKSEGWKIIAVEQSEKSICYTDSLSENLMGWDKYIYVFGNEIVGVRKDILDIADTIIDIPMHGKKNSLNVSVTVGIIAYEASKFRQSK